MVCCVNSCVCGVIFGGCLMSVWCDVVGCSLVICKCVCGGDVCMLVVCLGVACVVMVGEGL